MMTPEPLSAVSAARPGTVAVMLLAAVALLAGALAGLMAGGRFGPGGRPGLRHLGLLVMGAACEAAGDRWAQGWSGWVLLIAGYGLLLAFGVSNLRVTGMALVAIGLVANATVIGVDGGMPVRGVPVGVSAGPRHHGERPSDHLTGLADVVRIGPLGETVSAGDLVLSLGTATVMFGLANPPSGRVGARGRRRGQRGRGRGQRGRSAPAARAAPAARVERAVPARPE